MVPPIHHDPYRLYDKCTTDIKTKFL